jgi:hypothetical protein
MSRLLAATVILARMISAEEFAKNFVPYSVPPELEKLLAFQEGVAEFGQYSEGFGLLRDDKGGLQSWSDDSAFLSRLLPFAAADGSGSFYALWANAESDDCGSFPVIAFGGEGGMHVVAEDVRGLLRILALDAEPMISLGGVGYYKDDAAHSAHHDAYLRWMSELGLSPAQAPMAIVEAAQAKYQAAFEAWSAQYYES